MKVQAVELVTRHGIDLLLHKLFAAEMSGHINHESPIVKSRSILYFTDATSRLVPSAGCASCINVCNP